MFVLVYQAGYTIFQFGTYPKKHKILSKKRRGWREHPAATSHGRPTHVDG